MSHSTKMGGVTEAITLPSDGIVSLSKPEGTEVYAYVNGSEVPTHHIHASAGDSIYFKVVGHTEIPASLEVQHNGETRLLAIQPWELDSSYNQSYEMENEMTPAETINLFANPGMGNNSGGAMGAGLGAGVLGGVLGGALLGNNKGGLFGNNGGDPVIGPNLVTHDSLATQLGTVTETLNNTTILQTLGDIKASIPYNEAQVQLALSQTQASLTSQINQAYINTNSELGQISRDITNAASNILAGQVSTREAVNANGAANLTATLNSKFELASTVRDDGDKTRALIESINSANLSRQLSVAESALLEQRAIGRSRDVEVNVTQNVAQNQAQAQQQFQQQQQFLTTNNLLQAILSQAQIAQATNQSLVIGNTGYASAGAQTANPVNVRA